MHTSESPENSDTRAFDSDVEYLLAEIAWVLRRTQRIKAQKESQDSRLHPPRTVLGARCVPSVMVCGERVDCLARAEQEARSRVDKRLEVGASEGRIPSLIRMCRDHGFGDVEKHVLLLGMVPALGSGVAEKHLFGLDSTYASSQLYLETVFEFLELGYAERIHALPKLLPDGTLRRERYVQLCYEPGTPCALVGAGIELTGKAVAMITGIPAFSGFVADDDHYGVRE